MATKRQPGFFQIRLNRHPHALPGEIDHERAPSDVGVKQSKTAKKRYRDALRRGIGHVFSSPALRCTSIARIVCGVEPKIVDSLMPFSGPLDAIFKKYGYEIDRYAADLEAHTLMTLYGQTAAEDTVGKLLADGYTPKHGDTVVIFGHAIVLNYVALALSAGLCSTKQRPYTPLLRHIEEAGEIRMKFRLDGSFVSSRFFS